MILYQKWITKKVALIETKKKTKILYQEWITKKEAFTETSIPVMLYYCK